MRYGSPQWRRYLREAAVEGRASPAVARQVAAIVAAVRRDGDSALRRYTARFDGIELPAGGIRVRPDALRAAAERAPAPLVRSLRAAARRIEAFHRRQQANGFRMRLADGSVIGEDVHAIPSAGLYVPGGAGAYPSSVLMNAIPARVAGVPRLAVTTPPRALQENPALAAALVIAGAEDNVFGVGGAQAIAALAYGTRTIERVDRIVGPGNAYVTAAKALVRGTVEIDHEAGPSEVLILADGSARAEWVAADLLAQAEHGSGDERVVLVTTSLRLARQVRALVVSGTARVANPVRASRAVRLRAAAVLVANLADGIAAANALALEHAEIMTRHAAAVAKRIVAGAVFAGAHSPVAVGDYGIGPNHVLPTGGRARAASPLSVRDFERRQSYVSLTPRGLLGVARDVVRIAQAEGFVGHARSVLVRTS